jgi:hypothetical protein
LPARFARVRPCSSPRSAASSPVGDRLVRPAVRIGRASGNDPPNRNRHQEIDMNKTRLFLAAAVGLLGVVAADRAWAKG